MQAHKTAGLTAPHTLPTSLKRTSVTQEQAAILLESVLSPERPPVSSAIRRARLFMYFRGIECPHSDSTLRRFINAWKSKNADWWVFCRRELVKQRMG